MRDRREALARFGRNLREAREKTGLSQAEVARRVRIRGFTCFYLDSLEAGALECRFLTAMRLADVLGIGIEDLLDGIVRPDDRRLKS